MASIQVPEGNRLKHECGGFVVADQWVMTAVHCMPNGWGNFLLTTKQAGKTLCYFIMCFCFLLVEEFALQPLRFWAIIICLNSCLFSFSISLSLYSANGRKVVLGVHSLSEAEDTKQTFDIMELHNHPDFSIENYDNDIALIKVSLTFLCQFCLIQIGIDPLFYIHQVKYRNVYFLYIIKSIKTKNSHLFFWSIITSTNSIFWCASVSSIHVMMYWGPL